MIQPSVSSKIRGVMALFVISLLVLGIVDLLAVRDTLISEKKLKTRHLVEAAHSIVAHYADRQQRGEMSRDAAQTAAKETLRAMRYEGTEYFWINNLEQPVPRMVMHPTVPALDGQLLGGPEQCCATRIQIGHDGEETPLTEKTNLFAAFNQVANQGGHGYVAYDWPKPLTGGGATRERHPKISYVKLFEPWGWLIGSGIYVDDVDAMIRERSMRHLALIALIGSVLALLAALLGRSIIRPLTRNARVLEQMTRGERPLAPLPVERNDEIGSFVLGFNHLQEALKKREEGQRLAASVFENAREGIVITDVSGNIVATNPGFTRLTGYSAEEVKGRNPNLLKSGHQAHDFYTELWATLVTQGYWQGEVVNRRKDGAHYVEMLTITAVRDETGATSHYVGIFSDITVIKEHQSRLDRMAHHDALTELPNRILFADRLQLALKQAERKDDLLAVAFLDLDGFKPVNDRLGHDAGDKLLIEVAQRLRQCVRAGDTVSRFGGDEFVLLLVGLEDMAEAVRIIERALFELARPYRINGDEVAVSASIGLTLSPLDGSDGETLLCQADQAMYAAKQAGRNCYRVYQQPDPATV